MSSAPRSDHVLRRPDWVPVTAGGITIAVTVYDRRDYVLQAIESALAQRKSVKVLVVEDCGPDPGMRSFVEEHFGSRIQYHRNSSRRGLFGNWNVCLELCTTPWISILHDDDYLDPDFVDAMEELAEALPNRGAYFSSIIQVDRFGWTSCRFLFVHSPAASAKSIRARWRTSTICFSRGNFFALMTPALWWFPRNITVLRRLGNVVQTRLSFRRGADQPPSCVFPLPRGRRTRDQSGCAHWSQTRTRLRPSETQSRFPPERSTNAVFDRRKLMRASPLPTRSLLQNADLMSPRLLRYNLNLLLLSRPPHWRYRIFQAAVRLFGPGFVRALSTLRKNFAGRP